MMLFRIFRIASAALLISSAAFAQISLNPGDALPKVTIDGSVQKRTGDQVEGMVVAKVMSGWHINSATPLDEFAIPTALTLDPAAAELTGTKFPPHELKAFAFSGGKQIAVYQGTVQIPFTAKLKPGATAIPVTLRYQACSDNICLPPNTAKATINATAVAPTAAVPAPAPAGAFTPVTEAPKDYKPAATDRLSRTFESSGLPLTLLLLFVGGLALNLTPCVFPLIPITLGFFAMQSDGRRSRRFGLSAMYVLGIVITYSTLGVIAALGGKMFGAWLQLPGVLIGFALLMLVLASSMFGAFEIQPPRWIANRSQGRAGMAGALTMGLLIGIVAAPCVGPVVISLLSLVAAIGKPVTGGVMFASLAFGLGFPYLALLNALPRPGEWMLQVKRAMGFVLVAMAFYFLRSLTGEAVFHWGVALSLLVGAGFLFLSRGTAGRAMRLACAVVLLVAGVAFAIPSRGGVDVRWDKYEASSLAAASAANKPVVIDFYADWCIPCKELDEKTFRHPKVAAELDRFVRIKSDMTFADDAKTKQLTTQYGILGFPTIVFLDSNGREIRDLRLTGFEAHDRFLERLKQVK